jgi:hypothetical protein
MLLQLGGSVVAVLALAGIAWALKLGGRKIADEAEAIATAEAMLSGFEAERAVVGSDGLAALVHGRDESLAVLKVHGARIAARRLALPVEAEATADGLRIATGEAFGTVTVRGVDLLP